MESVIQTNVDEEGREEKGSELIISISGEIGASTFPQSELNSFFNVEKFRKRSFAHRGRKKKNERDPRMEAVANK